MNSGHTNSRPTTLAAPASTESTASPAPSLTHSPRRGGQEDGARELELVIRKTPGAALGLAVEGGMLSPVKAEKMGIRVAKVRSSCSTEDVEMLVAERVKGAGTCLAFKEQHL